MRPEPTTAAVGARLAELAAARHRVTLAGLSRMIGRSDSYLTRFVNHGVPARLAPDAIEHLSAFFGVEKWELGGFIGPKRVQQRRDGPAS